MGRAAAQQNGPGAAELPVQRAVEPELGQDVIAGAAAHARKALKPDGTLMLVEPMAGDSLADNLNPVGRVFYAFSTAVCVPASLNQEVATALGAQAGEKRLSEVVRQGGFSRFRRAAETPFNMVLEARP